MNFFDFHPSWTTPKGQWETLYDEVSIRGEEYRRDSCLQFVKGVIASLKAKTEYGVSLEFEPSNPHDPLAIKVIGFWTEQGWIFKRHKATHIGYIPRNMAFGISKKLKGRSLAACLRSIEMDDDINIVIDVLVS